MHRKGYLFIVLLLSLINSNVSCLLHTKALEQLVLHSINLNLYARFYLNNSSPMNTLTGCSLVLFTPSSYLIGLK